MKNKDPKNGNKMKGLKQTLACFSASAPLFEHVNALEVKERLEKGKKVSNDYTNYRQRRMLRLPRSL